ncbi:MAG: hypothetical protein KAJ19_16205, partial [Gammaproteobacteria bacterium]|nr:hypothetical protein [Gammaproteobacteria bacterium]
MAAFAGCNVTAVFSEEDAGTKPQVDLAGARLLAMGGTGVALDAGVYGLYRNPATLSLSPAFGFSFTERELTAPSSRLLTGGASVPVRGYGDFAFSFGDMWVGNVEGYDDEGNPTGVFAYHDRVFGGGYARRLLKFLTAGGAFRCRRVGYGVTSYSTAAVDAGVILNPVPADYVTQRKYGILTVGASVTDIGIKVADYPSGDYKPKAGINLGAAWSRRVYGGQEMTVAGECSTGREDPFNLGFEYSYAYTVHGRAGYNGFGPTFGIGLSQNLFDFDYALVKREAGFEHVVTFSLFPGRDVRAEPEKRRRIETWLGEGRAYYEIGNYEL